MGRAPSTIAPGRRHKPVLVVLRALIALALIALAGVIGYQIGGAHDPSRMPLPTVRAN